MLTPWKLHGFLCQQFYQWTFSYLKLANQDPRNQLVWFCVRFLTNCSFSSLVMFISCKFLSLRSKNSVACLFQGCFFFYTNPLATHFILHQFVHDWKRTATKRLQIAERINLPCKNKCIGLYSSCSHVLKCCTSMMLITSLGIINNHQTEFSPWWLKHQDRSVNALHTTMY